MRPYEINRGHNGPPLSTKERVDGAIRRGLAMLGALTALVFGLVAYLTLVIHALTWNMALIGYALAPPAIALVGVASALVYVGASAFGIHWYFEGYKDRDRS